jgi:hypothetical protein
LGSIGALVAATSLLAAGAFEANGQEAAATPEQQLEKLLEEYQRPQGRGPSTDAERVQLIGRGYRHHHEVALRLIELAERHPTSAVARRALIQAAWQVNTTWPVEVVGEDTASGRALALLQRDHLGSDELGPLCRRIGHGLRREYETFLRAALAGSPHPQVRGVACLALAHHLGQRLLRRDLLELQEESRKEFAALFGAEHLDALLRADRAESRREIEALLERAAKEFAAVEDPDGGTVGEKVAAELFELRHLCVGATAPEIEGEDQHGVRFKLSDLRGEVVLLDFWSWV